MKDLSREVDIPRLMKAIHSSCIAKLKQHSERTAMIEAYSGIYYGAEGRIVKPDPVNLLGLYVDIITQTLIAKNPRCMLSTFYSSQKPTVAAMEGRLNTSIEKMRLENTLRRAVVDGLFGQAIVQVSLAEPEEAAKNAWGLEAGKAFASVIDYDDFFFDHHARDFEEAQYMGYFYRVPLDVVKDSKHYNKNRNKLSASLDRMYNIGGVEMTSMISRGYAGNQEEFEDMVDLAKVYLPRHRLVVTISRDDVLGSGDVQGEALRVQRWIGPETGPFRWMRFGTVPSNAEGRAPIQNLYDLHKSGNEAFRKILRMAARIKSNTLYDSTEAESAAKVKTANDGDMVPVRRADAFNEITQGDKAIQPVMAVFMVIKDLFSFMGGNLELLGGRSAQSKTATQDEMLNQNAGAGVAALQTSVIQFTTDVIKSLLWYDWHDPISVHEHEHTVMPGISAPLRIHPASHPDPRALRRRGPMPEIKIDPYSMQQQTPQSRMAAINQVVQQVITPMMPLLQQQGIQFDVHAYLTKIASYLDMPDLPDLLNIGEPPEQSQSGGGDTRPKMPTQTQRSYERISRPGRTQHGDSQQLVNKLLGNKTGAEERNGQAVGT